MAVLTNENIALSFFDGFNAHDMSLWAKHLADNFTGDYPGASGLNKEQAQMYNGAFIPAFPNILFTVERVLEDGEFIVAQWVASGTHTGVLMTVSGQQIPPTGKSASVYGVLISQVQGGKIVREYTYWDQTALLAQLGLI